jgi:pSer/pThr/pTyr-binding forkhead associated (FHA) protein
MDTTASGRFCPVCKFKNRLDAAKCEFCGHPFKSIEGILTTKQVEAEKKETNGVTSEEFKEELDELLIPTSGIAIYRYDGKPIATRVEKEFYLGRKTEENDPVVDLIPFGAFQLGVSRRHALIRATQAGYEIIDNDSTNGTWLNKQRLIPNRAYPLPNGTIIRLAQMQLVVYCAKLKSS